MNIGIDPVTAAGLTYQGGKWIYDYQTGLVEKAKAEHEGQQIEHTLSDIEREENRLASFGSGENDETKKVLIMSGVAGAALLSLFLFTR